MYGSRKRASDPYTPLGEVPLFAASDNHAGLQIADLLASTLVFPMAASAYCPQRPGNPHSSGCTRACGRPSVLGSAVFNTATAMNRAAGVEGLWSVTLSPGSRARGCSSRSPSGVPPRRAVELGVVGLTRWLGD
ncbi:DUF3800 domain-containing protein [Nonomuraea sp. NPDC046570]|uniref:DUF3800 domain-containing protein n=1 Tax=Nonomuraea sp. NPDC046570 TaxID=3155255 RepID=UPI0034000520